LNGGIGQANNDDCGETVGVIYFDFDDDTFKTHYGA
jgi:hypothetical protein